MQFDIITLFPEMFSALNYGIVGRAKKQDLLSLRFWNPRDFVQDKQQGRVDDRPYGGGPGMVMQVQPLRDAINKAKQADDTAAKIIYLSPQGRLIKQADIQRFAEQPKIILIAGRYEGIDERVISNDIDEEWSIGDYILSGGELAAMVMIDAIVRLLPGALGDPTSAINESFSDSLDGLLDYPHYTRPVIDSNGQAVPEVLINGDHEAIRRWRLMQSLGRTYLKRPDLLTNRSLNPEEAVLLQKFLDDLVK